jgi:hypothetical protein
MYDVRDDNDCARLTKPCRLLTILSTIQLFHFSYCKKVAQCRDIGMYQCHLY